VGAAGSDFPVFTPAGEFFAACAKPGDAVNAAIAAAVDIKIRLFRKFIVSLHRPDFIFLKPLFRAIG
jgi:hypothetical protein